MGNENSVRNENSESNEINESNESNESKESNASNKTTANASSVGTQVVDLREALRQAIDEEMERDAAVFVMGEEVGEYNGAYKVTKGMLNKWGPKRIVDTPISELGFVG